MSWLHKFYTFSHNSDEDYTKVVKTILKRATITCFLWVLPEWFILILYLNLRRFKMINSTVCSLTCECSTQKVAGEELHFNTVNAQWPQQQGMKLPVKTFIIVLALESWLTVIFLFLYPTTKNKFFIKWRCSICF